jgi:hypothetical protein
MNIYDVLGLIGALLITYLFFYSQSNKRFLSSYLFYIGNIFGSSTIILSLLLSSFNLPSLIIELLWVSVSIYGMVLKFYSKSISYFDATIYQGNLALDHHFFNTHFNATTMISPSFLSPSLLHINDIDDYWFSNIDCKFINIGSDDNISSVLAQFNSSSASPIFINKGNKPVLFINKNFDENINFTYNQFSELINYISDNNFYSCVIINELPSSPYSESDPLHSSLCNVMNPAPSNNQFVPIIFYSKNIDDITMYSKITIRLGNIPNTSCQYFPVSIKLR